MISTKLDSALFTQTPLRWVPDEEPKTISLINNSGLKPLGKAVLIETHEPERKAGLIAIPEHIAGKMAMVENRARVVEVGADAWADERVPRAQAGDVVLVTRFAGFMAMGPKDGKVYRLVNDRDIFCGITYEGDSNAA